MTNSMGSRVRRRPKGLRPPKRLLSSSVPRGSGSTAEYPGLSPDSPPLNLWATSGAFQPSPASNISLTAVRKHKGSWNGVGLDWGTGIGILALACAQSSAVKLVYGLDIEKENIDCANLCATHNGLNDKTRFVLADSYTAVDPDEREIIDNTRFDFIVANPPASDLSKTDGFEFRRVVMRGAVQRLKPGGILLIQALSYYGIHRIEEMCRELPALCHEGIAATSEWVPLWTSEESKKLLRNQLKG